MGNIFKTTLKKDVIAEIANNGKREVRFGITKFWATRFADKFDLKDKTFVFKTFDTLEFSSPSNKDTEGATYVFNYVKTLVDGDEFVVMFKDIDDNTNIETNENVDVNISDNTSDVEKNIENVVVEEITEESKMLREDINDNSVLDSYSDSDYHNDDNDEKYINEELEVLRDISIEDLFDLLTQLFEEEKVLDDFYADENVFATNAKQVIVLPKGNVLGFKKTLPVNNDVEVRVEFDMNMKIYFDSNPNFDSFVNDVLNTLYEIRKNNFVFVWKRYTGIFIDDNGIYFGIKYSTRKSIGFNRKYNVQ